MADDHITMIEKGTLSILKNTSATIVARGAAGLVRIVALLLIARAFGAEQFGNLSLVLSFIEIFKIVADAGVDTISVRRFAAYTNGREELLNNIVGLKIILSIISFIAVPIIFKIIYGNGQHNDILLIVASSICTTLVLNAFVSYFQSQLAMAKALIANLIGSSFFLLFIICGVALQLPLVVMTIVFPLAEIISLIVIMKQYTQNHRVRIGFDKEIVWTILKDSVYAGLGGIIVVTYLRLDTLMIGGILGGREVGVYSVAYRLIEPFFLLFSSLSLSLYASLSSSWEVAPASHSIKMMNRVIVRAGVLGFLGASIVTFVVPQFVPLISDEYAKAAQVLPVLGWSVFFKAVNPQLTAVLNSLGKFRIIMVIAAGNLMMTLMFNMILIPLYGIVGAAVTVVAVEGINTLVQSITIVVFLKSRVTVD
ncbi:MAG: oligosaccharide flippase family protein [Ignavibacteriae bacterium]|nr:oligosaccharide flippase family protein [Ignavibacteriota bacterium]